MWTDRTKILVGEEGLNNLKNVSVSVIGVGGVGGYVCLMLARAGIEKITLVDFDTVDESNINRQAVANVNTIGMFKTEVMKKLIQEINPKCEVSVFNERFCAEFANTFFESHKFDYVVDAIDSVQDKVDLICCCKEKNINIISAMGAGNRIGVPKFNVMDIYKTSNDGLAKVIRKKLRERDIKSLDVVICEDKALQLDDYSKVGSISYYPAMCGCVLGAFVINQILIKQ